MQGKEDRERGGWVVDRHRHASREGGAPGTRGVGLLPRWSLVRAQPSQETHLPGLLDLQGPRSLLTRQDALPLPSFPSKAPASWLVAELLLPSLPSRLDRPPRGRGR